MRSPGYRARRGLGRARAGGRPLALYDLDEDPGETRYPSAEHPEVLERLTARLDAWSRAHPTQGAIAQRGAEERREMDALGHGGIAEELESEQWPSISPSESTGGALKKACAN